MEEVEWMSRANCTGIDTNQFFTETTTYENLPTLRQICANCDVVKECHAYALKYNVLGWWGNTSEKIRRDQRRVLKIIPIDIV